jgi:hypothetical protein
MNTGKSIIIVFAILIGLLFFVAYQAVHHQSIDTCLEIVDRMAAWDDVEMAKQQLAKCK